jgi:hypothetical protein
MRRLTLLLFILLLSVSTYSCNKYFESNNPPTIDSNNNEQDNNKPDSDVYTTPSDQTNKEDDIDNGNTQNQPVDSDNQEDKNNNMGEDTEEPARLSIEIEGTTEEITASLYHSPIGYKMIYDNERFKLSSEEGFDSYLTENSDPEKYPNIYIRISSSNSPNPIIKELDKEQKSINTFNEDVAVYVEDVTIGTYTGKHYKLKTGDEWDSIIRNFYIIEDNDVLYIIETQYFLEAAEGYGARIAAILNTFEIK